MQVYESEFPEREMSRQLYVCWRKHLQRIKGRKEVSKRALRQCRSDDYERRRKEDWTGRVSDCSANLPLARLIVSL